MGRNYLRIIVLVLACAALAGACAKDESHWGQRLDPDGKWWKKEGQSWDRKSNIFMTIGHSNPDWTEVYDQRQSADLNARSQVASFMGSLVANYMEEVRSRNFTISQSVVEASSKQTVEGSVIVSRHCKKGGKYKGCRSLIKVDLSRFFAMVENDFADDMTRDLRRRAKRSADIDAEIQEKVQKTIEELKQAEEQSVEKTLQQP
ncbi:MAG: hypothetical protein JXA24_01000 [Proteobacteria bacterium]|nr:hypothetical protein [Pseudomonadota bacterium]